MRKGALLGKKFTELHFGDVIQDHFPVQRPGNQVRTDHGGVDGLENAMRPHELCSNDSFIAIAQQKALSFASAEDLGLACSYAQQA